MSIRRPTVIVFDFDGTLVDSVPSIAQVVRRILQHYQHSLDLTMYASRYDEIFGAIHPAPSAIAQMVQMWIDWERPFQPNYQLFPSVYQTLQTLSQDATLAIWTARDRATTHRLLEKFGIASLIQFTRCGDDGANKPDPAGLLEIARHFGSSSEIDLTMIGDSYSDLAAVSKVRASTPLRVQAIGANWCSHSSAEVLWQAGAQAVYQSCDQLISHFRADN